ncbi:permease-like cell division protein FtsX [Desulfovirgula thermocuniculi]|uniref:permease-like cell division protein FtsX n=1 Tax=Desulfovirgula thermocuniculi TaxID=348842 RepID=UPI00040EAEA2|nr:permease-like cell division protein FtsX [Desulfovirgula thermocuniculi]
MRALKYYFREALLSIARNSWLSLAAVGTVTVSLFILGFSLLVVMNVNRLADYLESSVEVSIFLKDGLTGQQLQDLQNRIRALPGVVEVQFISKKQALEEMKKNLGPNRGLLEGLEEDNPLPDAFRVRTQRADQVAAVAKEAASLPGVEDVRYGQGVVERLVAVTRWVRLAGLASMALIGAAAVFLISTTIRLSVFSRQREIGIMKYLGATNWFVRFPFLLEGMMLGLAGSALAALLVHAGYAAVVRSVTGAMPFIPVVGQDQAFFALLGSLVALGLLVGAAGSLISIRRFLNV